MRKPIYYLSTLITACLLLIACSGKKGEDATAGNEPPALKPIRYIGSYARDFSDLNDLHLEAAGKIGIAPLAKRDKLPPAGQGLLLVQSCDFYEVEELSHSIPYLVPQAAFLLYRIGLNFSDSLASHNAPAYLPIVTSVTRTKEDIAKLGQRNTNASENSAHMYGTTFDVSWRRFKKLDDNQPELTEEQLKMLLASVLRDLQKEGKCYIKHERKQACFHITAR